MTGAKYRSRSRTKKCEENVKQLDLSTLAGSQRDYGLRIQIVRFTVAIRVRIRIAILIPVRILFVSVSRLTVIGH